MREYLIVCPAEELVERFVLAEGRYGSPDVFGGDETLSSATFSELRVNLWEVFDKQAPQRDTEN